MNKGAELRGYKPLIVGIIIVAIIITVLFIPMMPIKEAYSETEEYEREAMYEVVSAKLEEDESIVVVKNIDAYGGTFTVTHYLYAANVTYATKTTGEYLSAGQNKTFRAEFDTQGLQDVHIGYSVSTPTIIDKRVVARHRTVYKSVIELLIYS